MQRAVVCARARARTYDRRSQRMPRGEVQVAPMMEHANPLHAGRAEEPTGLEIITIVVPARAGTRFLLETCIERRAHIPPIQIP